MGRRKKKRDAKPKTLHAPDLPDGGAALLAAIRANRSRMSRRCSIERVDHDKERIMASS